MMHKTMFHLRFASRGFTLLELMLVVSIITILASLAIGFSGNFTQEEKLKETARGVQSAIALARAEAVRTSSTMTVVLTPQRIYAFKDVNNDGVFNAGDTSVFQYPAAAGAVLPTTTRLTSSDFPSFVGGTNPTLYFNDEGLSYGPSGLRSGTVCVKSNTVTDARAVQMTVAGACRIQGQAVAASLCP